MTFACFSRKKKVQNITIEKTLKNMKDLNISPTKQKGKNQIKQLSLQETSNSLYEFTQEKSIYDQDYLFFGFSNHQEYEQYLDYASKKGIDINIISAKCYRKERKDKFDSFFISIMKELERRIYEQDWVIEMDYRQKQYKNANEILENYRNAKFDYIQSKKALQSYINEQINIGDYQTFKDLIVNTNLDELIEKSCRDIINYEIQFEQKYKKSEIMIQFQKK